MKISIKNFGPIDHFEFDLEKDLHVIYGENNIGKSWAINLIYLLLKSSKEILSLDSEKIASIVNENAKEIELASEGSVYFPNFPKEYEEFIDKLNRSLDNTFGEMKNLLSHIEPEITLVAENFEKIVKRYSLDDRDEYPPMFYVTAFKQRSKSKSVNHKSLQKYDTVSFLPASKSGIYQVLSNMGNIFAQLSQYKNQLKDSSLQLPSMSEPISDYILNLSSIQASKQGNFKDLVNFLEENIIEGKVTFDEFQKKLRYTSAKTGLNLELHEASSMIAEVSPLIAYLKYIVPKSNTILFVEEPEAHLHPKIQVEMMKVFVQLVKAGVKVVITTHSDFMMDSLTNQILAGEIKADNISSYHLVMGEKGSYDAGDMKATADGTQDHNFVSVSEQLYNERMELYEKLNKADAVEEN
jgi:predicted ATPase